MKVRKAVKKIVALGVGATMLGASVLGATAADMGNFPDNFVDDESGSFNGLFVVGASAAPADIVGVNAIATAVQSKAVKETWVETDSSEVSFSSEDGKFVADGSGVLLLGEGVLDEEKKFDEDDFPDLLADGMVKDDDGENEEYEYDQEIKLGNSTVTSDESQDDDIDIPQVHLDTEEEDVTTYTYVVDFSSDRLIVAGDSSNGGDVGLADNEKIVMLGQEFTFDDIEDNDDDLVLYRSSMSRTVELGESIDVDVDGEEYTVELIAINSDADPAKVTLMVNGESSSLEDGDQKTIGGLELKVDDIQINTIGEQRGLAKIFIGADEVTIPAGAQDINNGKDTIEVNGEDLDGVEVSVTGNWTGGVEKFEFAFTPSDFNEDEGYDPVDYMYGGESFVDPLFGVIKYQFVTPDVERTDEVKLEGGDDELDFTYTNVDGDELTVTLLNGTSGTHERYNDDYQIHETVFGHGDLQNLIEDDVFVLGEGNDEDEVTSFYRVTDFNYDGDEVDIENLNTGDEKSFKDGDELWNTEVDVDGINKTHLNLTTNGLSHVITEDYMEVTFAENATNESQKITFEETDPANRIDNDVTLLNQTVNFSVNSDDEFEIKRENSDSMSWTSGDNNYDDIDYTLTFAGTQGQYDSDDYAEIAFLMTPQQVSYNVWVGPAEGAGESASSGSGYWQTEVVPIPASATVLDSELDADPTSENLIVVGGPCVNSVAADLMDNPDNCAEGFSEGKAKIKLFGEDDGMESGKVAMLVAGYSGADTRRATTVLNNYGDYDLSGSEVEVSGTSMTDITVGEPTVMEEEEETEEPAEDAENETA